MMKFDTIFHLTLEIKSLINQSIQDQISILRLLTISNYKILKIK